MRALLLSRKIMDAPKGITVLVSSPDLSKRNSAKSGTVKMRHDFFFFSTEREQLEPTFGQKEMQIKGTMASSELRYNSSFQVLVASNGQGDSSVFPYSFWDSPSSSVLPDSFRDFSQTAFLGFVPALKSFYYFLLCMIT